MYLRKALILNIGPLSDLSVSPKFDEQGNPIPLVLVGGNGSGKTTFLSLVADALVELAKTAFADVAPEKSGIRTPFFRLVGTTNQAIGAESSLALLNFDEDETKISYCEKVGKLDPAAVIDRVSDDFPGVSSWPADGNHKSVSGNKDTLKTIYSSGAYVFFPSSRAEIPHWLNIDSLDREPHFELQMKFSDRLSKPLFVERGLNALKPWLLDVIVDARIDAIKFLHAETVAAVIANVQNELVLTGTIININRILGTIIGDRDARIVCLNRSHAERRLCIMNADKLIMPSLDHLSSGQATLLSMFGTIIRYGEKQNILQSLDLGTIRGLVVIDEIDAHLHTDLQYDSLPNLIKLFPRVQFIVTSHAPLFLLGMQNVFGEGGVQIVELPHGHIIDTERFSEFTRSFTYYRDTKLFDKAITSAVASGTRPLIFTEGETDPRYLKTAMELCGYQEFLDSVDIEWVGAKSDEAPQGFNSGDTGLNHTRNVLTANPILMRKRVVLLYDSDAKKLNEDIGLVSVRCMPRNSENKKVKKGIENLLPASLFESKFYRKTQKVGGDGGKTVISKLMKTQFCDWVCGERREPGDFGKFEPLILELQAILQATEAADQDG